LVPVNASPVERKAGFVRLELEEACSATVANPFWVWVHCVVHTYTKDSGRIVTAFLAGV
jgi:hypothetical protein